jgi:hypothetical protein
MIIDGKAGGRLEELEDMFGGRNGFRGRLDEN